MSKKLIYIIGGIVLILALSYFFYVKTQSGNGFVPVDYTTLKYMIAGKSVGLGEGGVSYFGNTVGTDLNADGRTDLVSIITQNVGENIFYYLVADIATPKGHVGSQAVLLGDRIAPQTTEVRAGANSTSLVVVNYADRKPGEAFTVNPSVGKSLVLKFDPKDLSFGEVVQNFEGEADPSKMSLSMKAWEWQFTADKQGQFVITFGADGRFSSKTDCNTVSGSYTAKDGKLSFGKDMISTKMFCEGSKEQEYTQLLSEVTGYTFTGRGELVLALTAGRAMTFK